MKKTTEATTAASVACAPLPIRRRRTTLAGALLSFFDICLILAGFAIAYWMRYELDWPPPFDQLVREVQAQNFVPLSAFAPFALLLAVLLVVQFAMRRLYRLPRTAGVLDHASIIVGSTTTGIAILIVVVFLYKPSEFYSRLIFAFAWGTIIALLVGWRAVLIGIRRWRWVRGIDRERVLVVGNTGLGREMMESLVAQPDLGYALVGFLDDCETIPNRRTMHFRQIGRISDLETCLRGGDIDLVILALPFWEHHRLPDLVAICRYAGVEFRVVPDLYELSFDRIDIGNLSGIPLIGLKEVSLRGWNLVVKRAMDLALTLLAAPLVIPLGVAIAIIVRLDSPGPAIFRQRRIGRDGRPFICYKFRTMVVDAEQRKAELAALNEADGPLFKMRNDPRMTRVGRVLRRYSLDELPQLWNILRGEMSWVGPRPATPEEVAQYEDWHYRRLTVVPGLTGLSQVLGRSDISFDEMVRLDIFYTENWTPGMDLRILLQTIPVVISGRGAY
ncbi:MAG: sugar transferase [Roseiflexaceae bacterium]|nr:sugar transferase [Roseiflexaceae bacterium]